MVVTAEPNCNYVHAALNINKDFFGFYNNVQNTDDVLAVAACILYEYGIKCQEDTHFTVDIEEAQLLCLRDYTSDIYHLFRNTMGAVFCYSQSRALVILEQLNLKVKNKTALNHVFMTLHALFFTLSIFAVQYDKERVLLDISTKRPNPCKEHGIEKSKINNVPTCVLCDAGALKYSTFK